MSSWKVTLDLVTDEDIDGLQRFLDSLAKNRLLNTADNEEGEMINIDHLAIETEIRT